MGWSREAGFGMAGGRGDVVCLMLERVGEMRVLELELELRA